MKTIPLTAALLAGALAGAPLLAQDAGIPYQAEPRENLTVGGQPTLKQLQDFRAEGYTAVINLRQDGEFDDFDEATEVARLGMTYVRIPISNIKSITSDDARALHEALSSTDGPVLLHCTVGWRAGGLFAIENYLLHDASEEEALQLAAAAHMGHASADVAEWIRTNKQD